MLIEQISVYGIPYTKCNTPCICNYPTNETWYMFMIKIQQIVYLHYTHDAYPMKPVRSKNSLAQIWLVPPCCTGNIALLKSQHQPGDNSLTTTVRGDIIVATFIIEVNLKLANLPLDYDDSFKLILDSAFSSKWQRGTLLLTVPLPLQMMTQHHCKIKIFWSHHWF